MRRRPLAPTTSYALLALSEAPFDATAFARRGPRTSGAVGTAIAVHAVALLAAVSLVRLRPDPPAASPLTASAIARFVFTDATGEGSGRSGGGNRSADPPALLRTRGAEARAAAASAPVSLATPDAIVPERETAPVLPVVPMNAGDVAQVGAIDGVPGPPTDARGPGDAGIGTRIGDRGLGDIRGPGSGDQPYAIGNGVSAPTLIHRTSPEYSPEAMRAKLQGVALLSGVVGTDGVLHDIRVVRSLDAVFGLDQQAIACVKGWRFRPGTREGRAVAVKVTIEVAFTLR